MIRKLWGLVAVVLLALSFAGSVLAEMVEGKITKIDRGGREITVKAKGGKEVTIGISGSRTTLEGIGDRSEFKAGQSVVADVDGGEAKKVTVKKK